MKREIKISHNARYTYKNDRSPSCRGAIEFRNLLACPMSVRLREKDKSESIETPLDPVFTAGRIEMREITTYISTSPWPKSISIKEYNIIQNNIYTDVSLIQPPVSTENS